MVCVVKANTTSLVECCWDRLRVLLAEGPREWRRLLDSELEEELDRLNKDLRAAADDYISLKRHTEADIEYYKNELETTKTTYNQKLQQAEE